KRGGCSRFLLRCNQHRMAEVAPEYLAFRMCADGQHQISRTAAEIQDLCVRSIQYRLKTLHCPASPVFVDVEREQVVQQIVPGRAAPDNVASPAGSFLLSVCAARSRATHVSAA